MPLDRASSPAVLTPLHRLYPSRVPLPLYRPSVKITRRTVVPGLGRLGSAWSFPRLIPRFSQQTGGDLGRIMHSRLLGETTRSKTASQHIPENVRICFISHHFTLFFHHKTLQRGSAALTLSAPASVTLLHPAMLMTGRPRNVRGFEPRARNPVPRVGIRRIEDRGLL